MMRRLHVVRHGNTFNSGEPLRRVGARTDMPLVSSGMAQAEALGAWYAGRGLRFTRALCSPLLRTRQTAEAILSASAHPCPLEYADFLKEIDHGPDENALEEDVLARIGQDAIHAWDQHAQAPDGWIVNHSDRIDAWRRFLSESGSGDVLLVTSNGAARFILLAANLGVNASLKLRTGACAEILQHDADRFTIVDWDVRPK